MKRNPVLPLLISGVSAVHSAVAADQPAISRPENPPAAATLAQTLKSAGPNAAKEVVPATIAAIQGLGPEATPKQIAAIVYAAVRATPDSALNIVRAAVKLSPDAAPDIAAAAARAVPNPWKEVRYQRGTQPQPPPQAPPQLPPQPPGRKERDFKSEPDYKSSPVDSSLLQPGEAVSDPAVSGDPMSLAEAIVLTAVDAGGNLTDVQGAVDDALYGDPGFLFNKVSGVRGISGVGDAGNSNYANEPHLTKPPHSPDPNPVSR